MRKNPDLNFLCCRAPCFKNTTVLQGEALLQRDERPAGPSMCSSTAENAPQQTRSAYLLQNAHVFLSSCENQWTRGWGAQAGSQNRGVTRYWICHIITCSTQSQPAHVHQHRDANTERAGKHHTFFSSSSFHFLSLPQNSHWAVKVDVWNLRGRQLQLQVCVIAHSLFTPPKSRLSCFHISVIRAECWELSYLQAASGSAARPVGWWIHFNLLSLAPTSGTGAVGQDISLIAYPERSIMCKLFTSTCTL